MRDGRWKYTIRAYWPGNALFPKVPNGLAIETTHTTEASRDIEILVFRDRIKRGDLSYIEVISHVEPFVTETIF